jgi:CDP-diglyceride synthetase
MEPRLIARAVALGLAATALLTAVIFAWVLVYAYVVAPGHVPATYQAYAAHVAPLAGIVLGLAAFALAGHLAARHRGYSLALTLVPAATFILVDVVLLAAFQRSAFAAWPLLVLSWLSKLFAAWVGGRFGSRSSPA